MKDEAQIREDLGKAQINHLIFLEEWTAKQPTVVAGCNLLSCLNYELIQLVNHAYLREYLSEEDGN